MSRKGTIDAHRMIKHSVSITVVKKRHTVKNTVISTLDKVILLLGQAFAGHTHDYTMLKQEFPPEDAWFEWLQVLVALGYQGILQDYVGEAIHLPYKKPRKSKRNPDTSLTETQKRKNQALSKIRILVENAICGLKRYNILVHRFRNHKNSFANDVVGIAAALWNFNLRYQGTTLLFILGKRFEKAAHSCYLPKACYHNIVKYYVNLK